MMELMSKKAAKASGMTRYFTGRPCKNGHVSERNVACNNCLECDRNRGRIRYRANPGKYRKEKRNYYANNLNKLMLTCAKGRAKKHGLEFTITHEDILIPDVCPALGLPLKRQERAAGDCSPTLDRINPAMGYISGNVAVISNRANRIKNNATVAELRAVANWIERA